MKHYKIPIIWQAVTSYEVEANSLQEAVEKSLKLFYETPNAEYIQDSAEIDGIVYDKYEPEKLDIEKAFESV